MERRSDDPLHRSGVSGSAHELGRAGVLLQPRGRGARQKGSALHHQLVRGAHLRQRRLPGGNEELAAPAEFSRV